MNHRNMKTLIIVVHPNLTESVINKKWLDELLNQSHKIEHDY